MEIQPIRWNSGQSFIMSAIILSGKTLMSAFQNKLLFGALSLLDLLLSLTAVASPLHQLRTQAQDCVSRALQSSSNSDDRIFLETLSRVLRVAKFMTFFECNTFDSDTRAMTTSWAKIDPSNLKVSGRPLARLNQTFLHSEPDIIIVETILHETAHMMGVHDELLAEETALRILRRANIYESSLFVSSAQYTEILQKKEDFQQARGCTPDTPVGYGGKPNESGARYFGNYPELQSAQNTNLRIVITTSTGQPYLRFDP